MLDKLPYQKRLHRQQPEKFPSPICRICLKEEEDDFHFVVGCDRKWKVWKEASKELNLADQCSSKEKVWCIMLLLDRSATKPAGRGSILPLIGLIWAAIWQLHWQCIMEERLWFHESCLARICIQRLNLSMSINSTEEIEDDSLMPMATSYEESSNKSIHT